MIRSGICTCEVHISRYSNGAHSKPQADVIWPARCSLNMPGGGISKSSPTWDGSVRVRGYETVKLLKYYQIRVWGWNVILWICHYDLVLEYQKELWVWNYSFIVWQCDCEYAWHCESGEGLWLQGEAALQKHSFKDADPQPVIPQNKKIDIME